MIPETLADITSEWLTTALQSSEVLTTDEAITSATLHPIAQKSVQFHAQIGRFVLETDSNRKAIPRAIVAKLPKLNTEGWEKSLELFQPHLTEFRFYKQLAKTIPLRIPICYFTDMDVSASLYVFLLEDLSPYTLGSQLTGATLSQAKILLDQLAKFHAKFWQGENLAAMEWLVSDEAHDEEADTYIQEIFSNAWQYLKQQNSITLPASVLAFGDNIIQNGIPKHTDTTPVTLIHGDFRLENMFFDKDEPVIFDWEDIWLSPCTIDLAYFIGGNLPVKLSQSDTQLLSEYHRHLLDYGIEDYSFDDMMRDYRVAMVDSFIQGILTYHNNVENPSSAAFAHMIASRFIARADDLKLVDLFD